MASITAPCGNYSIFTTPVILFRIRGPCIMILVAQSNSAISTARTIVSTPAARCLRIDSLLVYILLGVLFALAIALSQIGRSQDTDGCVNFCAS